MHRPTLPTLLAQHLTEKFQEHPSYRFADLIKDVQREIGVKVSYSKAFRIKDRANEIIYGSRETG
jgi:hypothetical protein